MSLFEVFASNTQANFQNFYTLLFSNQSTISAREAQAANVAKIGGNATITRLFSDSISALLSNLTSSPDENQQIIIRQTIKETLGLSYAFISTLPGMENFENNTVLRSNPDNARFYQIYEELQMEGVEIIANPASALAYFSNISVIIKMSETIVLAGKISLQSRTCKYYNS
jgi:hypothetical protein